MLPRRDTVPLGVVLHRDYPVTLMGIVVTDAVIVPDLFCLIPVVLCRCNVYTFTRICAFTHVRRIYITDACGGYLVRFTTFVDATTGDEPLFC